MSAKAANQHPVGWVERKRNPPKAIMRCKGWVSLRSTHPTKTCASDNMPGIKNAPERLGRVSLDATICQPTAFGQVVLIQFAAAVDSLWPWPGFGQFGGAVILRMGIVITRFGSQVENGYSGKFLLNPIIASL